MVIAVRRSSAGDAMEQSNNDEAVWRFDIPDGVVPAGPIITAIQHWCFQSNSRGIPAAELHNVLDQLLDALEEPAVSSDQEALIDFVAPGSWTASSLIERLYWMFGDQADIFITFS